MLIEDDNGNSDIFICTNSNLAKGKYENSLTDLIGKRKIKQIVPVKDLVIQVSVWMPEGNIFGGEIYVIGCGKELNEFYWYKSLGLILLKGIDECEDKDEKQYLEQCLDTCKNVIKKCEKENKINKNINNTLDEIKKLTKYIDEDDDEEDNKELVDSKKVLINAKERVEELIEIRDALESAKNDVHKGYV